MSNASLIKAISKLKSDNEKIVVKLNYPTSVYTPNAKATSYPQVILESLDDSYSDVLVGTTTDNREVVINPDQIVYAYPYGKASVNAQFYS